MIQRGAFFENTARSHGKSHEQYVSHPGAIWVAEVGQRKAVRLRAIPAAADLWNGDFSPNLKQIWSVT